MTAILLASLLVTSPPSAGERPRADLRVTATDAAGAADVGLAEALARTLAEAGLTASPEHRRPDDCGDECVRVSVRKTDEHRFLIEVRGRGEVVRAPVRLARAASSFDQLHALAIEAELLTERVRSVRRKPAPRVIAAAPAPAPPPEEVARVVPEAGEPSPASPDRPFPIDDDDPIPPASLAAVPAVQEQAQPRVAPADERLALNLAGMILTDTAANLFTHGPVVGLRLRVTPGLDVRAAISFLGERDFEYRGNVYKLGMLPLTLAAAVEIPGVPSLRAGGGVEGVLIHSERAGQEAPLHWAVGPIARLEHRYAIRTFALISALQGALHPPSWNTARNADSVITVPAWTVGVAVGLEFRIF
jgi:hypothetical protein